MKITRSIAFSLFVFGLTSVGYAASVRVAGITITNWTFGGSTASIRIYSTKTFVTKDYKTVRSGTARGFYKTVNCTVVSTTVTCPSFIIDSITDSSDPTAKYVAGLYDAGGRMRLPYLDAFSVPTSLGSSTTWEELRRYNAAPTGGTPQIYNTMGQTATQFEDKQDATPGRIKTVNAQTPFGSDLSFTPANPAGYALSFDRTKGHHVYGGKVWRLANEATYGDFYYDWLAKPKQGAEYVFSAGYGGAHIFLGGFDGGASGRIGVTGNVSPPGGGAVDVSFNSGGDLAFIDQWVHVGVGRFANTIIVYMNGVPCKRFAKATNRGALFDFDLGLYVGGSDHSNFNGLLRWVRVFENSQPFYQDPNIGGVLRVSPRPAGSYFENVSSAYKTANIFYDFSIVTSTVVNLGSPLHEGDLGHGYRNAGTNTHTFSAWQGYAETDLPQYVALDAPVQQPDYALVPTPPPAGAKIFDSFQRNDVVYLWQNVLGLGSTESGSLGVKMWANSSNYGILFGRAFGAAHFGSPWADVGVDTSFMKVEVKNVGNELEGVDLYAAYDKTTDTGIKVTFGANNTVAIYKVAAGTATGLGFYQIPGNPTFAKMAVEYTSGRHIKLIVDDIVRIDNDDSANAPLSGLRAGFGVTRGYCRVKDFTVY